MESVNNLRPFVEACHTSFGGNVADLLLWAMAERIIAQGRPPLADAQDLKRSLANALGKSNEHALAVAQFVRWILLEDKHSAINCCNDDEHKQKIRRVAECFAPEDGCISGEAFHAASHSADEASRKEERSWRKSGPKDALALFVAHKFAEAGFCLDRVRHGSIRYLEIAPEAAAAAAAAATGVFAQIPERSPEAVAGVGLPTNDPRRREFEEWCEARRAATHTAQRKLFAKLIELLEATAD